MSGLGPLLPSLYIVIPFKDGRYLKNISDRSSNEDIEPILVNWLKNQNGLMKYIEVFRRVLNNFNNEV